MTPLESSGAENTGTPTNEVVEVTSLQLLALGFLLTLPVLWLWIRALMKRDVERMVEEFQRTFPGQCLICSCHRYGVVEGHTSGKVKYHDCIEQGDNRKEVG